MEYEIDKSTTIEDVLEMAVKLNNFKLVKKLLPIANKKILEQEHDSLLYTAIYEHRYKMFEYLAKTIDVDYMGDNDRTTLMLVIEFVDSLTTKDIKHILRHVKNINLKDEGGNTALDLLIERRCDHPEDTHIQIIKMLLEHGADPSIEDNEHISTIDIVISRKPDIQLLEILLPHYNKHVDINEFNNIIYENPKHDELYDVIDLLIPYIKDINELDIRGYSVLWNVQNEKEQHQDIIDLLIANGAISIAPDKK